MLRRLFASFCISLCAAAVTIVTVAAPASAHEVSGSGASNYKTDVTGIAPRTPNVWLTVKENGDRLELTNETSQEVTVIGYQGEPYIRIDRSGVYENRNSPTFYSNVDRYAAAPIPTYATPSSVPHWRHLDSGSTAIWHDHRVHWMSTVDPPQVKARPDRVHVLNPDWQVPIRVGNTDVVAHGTLRWIPPMSPMPWYALAVLAGVVVAAIGSFVSMRWTACTVLMFLTCLDIAHVVGSYLASTGTLWTRLSSALPEELASVIVWAVAIAAIRLHVRHRDEAAWFATLFSSVTLFVVGGLGDVNSLTHSQVVFAWSPLVARAVIAMTLGLGFGAAVLAAKTLWSSHQTQPSIENRVASA